MKKSLCVDARMIDYSGIGTYLRNLLPFLEKDFALTLLVKEKNGSGIDFDCPIYTVKEQLLFPYKVPSCDLFWSPHYNVPLLPIRAKKRAVTIHDLCHLAMPEHFPLIKRVPASLLLKNALKRSSLILTVSEFSKREISKVLPHKESKIHVVLNGIEKKKGELDIEEIGSKFLLYVGNIKPHKNIGRLLKAFSRLPPSYELVLAGRVSMPIELLEAPRVRVLGEVSEGTCRFLYEKAEALIQPSLYEGFGLTPLEAMAFGCPVISSPEGGLKEACGDAAFYIDPLSVDSLYQGMKAVLEDEKERERLILAGFERIAQFSWQKAADKIKELFAQEIAS